MHGGFHEGDKNRAASEGSKRLLRLALDTDVTTLTRAARTVCSRESVLPIGCPDWKIRPGKDRWT
jgi:hypothetical protein